MSSTTTEDEEKSGKHASGTLRKESLRAAGLSFLIADSSLIAFGRLAKEDQSRNMVAAGMFGLTAGAIGTIFGHHKTEQQLQQLCKDLSDHLREQGVSIPSSINDPSLTKKGGFLDRIKSFLYAHPSQMMNALYSMVGAAFIREGSQKDIRNLKISGALLISGALSGILIKEKKPDPAHPPQGFFEKIWSWIQEKPLRVTGTLFNANQVFLGLSVLDYRRRHPENKSYLFMLLAVAAFAFGNTMLMISNKSKGADQKVDMKTMNALADTSAQIIAAQPEQVRNAVLEDISTYLASKKNAPMQKDQIRTLLSARLAQAGRSQGAASWQGRVIGADAPSGQPSR